MKLSIIAALHNSIDQGIDFIKTLNDDQYRYKDIPPFNSSVGTHFRHVLEIFETLCAQEEIVDFSHRERKVQLEEQVSVAVEFANSLKIAMEAISSWEKEILLRDDIGDGNMVSLKSTRAVAAMQAISHANHHYAFMRQLAYSFMKDEVSVDVRFGYNPTSPKD